MPNPFKNPKLLREYYDAEPLCELSLELGVDWDSRSRRALTFFPPLVLRIDQRDVHHIWSVGRRPDFRSNLIALSRVWHDKFHAGHHGEQCPVRIMCMLAKARKAARLGDPSEFCVEELNTAAGLVVRGWVECATFGPSWRWVEKFRQELLRRIDDATSAAHA